MAIQTTSNLSSSVRVQYEDEYREGAMEVRLYDQLSTPIGKDMSRLAEGSSVQVNFLSEMNPATTAISQLNDVTPQTLREATASVTPTSRGEMLRTSELLDIQNFLDLGTSQMKVVGRNMMMSVDLLAQAAALQGNAVSRGTVRASLDAGTTGHLFKPATLAVAASLLETLKCPYWIDESSGERAWVAIMHPDVFYDFRVNTPVLEIGQYQRAAIHFENEVGSYGGFRLVKSAFAKVFGAAGNDNGTNVATTLNGAVNKLATTIVTADDVSANVAVGRVWTIGTEETAGTHYPDNERVRTVSASTNTITVIGEGVNGGLKFDHASGAAVRNADSVYPVAFGTPMSLAKVYEPSVGEFGQIVGPNREGNLEQWIDVGWKWYGGYGLLSQSWIVRGEYASSLDA